MFIGRERELKALQNVYNKDGFGMTIVLGRRRVGKSTLIAEFIKDKKAIFYTSTKVGASRNLELFSKQVIDVLDPSYNGATFSSLEAVFDFISNKIGEEKLILAIDELPYWAEKDEAFLSILQKYIDTKWLDKKMMVILCGSALSFMENKVLSEKSPIFGRRDSQIRVDAFDYKDSASFLPNYSYEEKAICYGVTGGVAKYLALFDPSKTLDENIISLFFNPDGYLYDEAKNLLTQEFSDVILANNVIEVVASGENELNNIAFKVHENASTVLYTLTKLIEVGLVEKRRCLGEEKNKKKTQYVLKDHMFRFYYRYILKALSVIEKGYGETYYLEVVKPELHSYMGYVFEDMCRLYTLKEGAKKAFGPFITEVGYWWGNVEVEDALGKKRRESADIDVVGVSYIDKSVVVGECKFKNEVLDKSVYETLCRRAALLPFGYKVERYLLFSLSGFSNYLREENLLNVSLLTLEDLYR